MDATLQKTLEFVSANRGEIRKLFSHERNGRVVFQGMGFRYERKSDGKYMRLSGVLAVIKEAFFPEVDYWQQLKVRNRLFGRDPKRKAHGRGPDIGFIRGTRVHRELDEFVKLDMKNFAKLNPKVHPWTKSVLRCIKDNEWIPVACEFMVFDPLIRVGTAIDMVCVTKLGKIVFLELKTGYGNGFFCGSKSMTGPLSKVMDDSPANQATLQLLLAMLIVIKYHRVFNVEGWVLRVRSGGDAYPGKRPPTDLVRVPKNFVLKHSESIYKHVCLVRGVKLPAKLQRRF